MKAAHYDIIMIGHISKDVLVYGGVEEKLVGGAVVYSSVSARKAGASVLVVTKACSSDRKLLEPYKKHGITFVIIDSPQTTSLRNVYLTEDRERRTITLLSQADSFTAEDIPELKTRIFHLAGLFRGEIPDELIPTLARKAQLALDVQGVLRIDEGGKLVFKDWENKQRLLPLITYLKTDAAEAEILTGETNRERAAELLHGMGAREVMITHNTEVIVYDGKGIYRAPFTSKTLLGRTGRGDTCFAAYLAWRHSHGIEEAVRFAAALTSIKMESPGVFRGSIRKVRARMAAG
ncbi:MAG: PfkB family carbohydrate kinase [Spirochaetota bacterium]